MKVEQKISGLMQQVGAGSLAIGIMTLVAGLVFGIIGIVNGGRLLKHHGDML